MAVQLAIGMYFYYTSVVYEHTTCLVIDSSYTIERVSQKLLHDYAKYIVSYSTWTIKESLLPSVIWIDFKVARFVIAVQLPSSQTMLLC